MRAEKYLEQIKKIDAIIINKMRDHKRWVDIAEGLGGFSVSEKVKSTRNLQQIPDSIAAYIDIEREIEELKLERESIIKTIEQLPSVEYKIIYQLYVKDDTLKEIAYQFDRSYEWVKKTKQKALRIVQEMIDEKKG